jgi:hypothetical protein
MRIPSIVVAACLVALATAPIAAAQPLEEPCEASPRYMVVRVEAYRLLDADYSDHRDLAHMVGEQVVDRCEVLAVHPAAFQQDAIGSVIEMRRQNHSDPHPLLLIVETPREICAALRDCAVVAGGYADRRRTDR